jgi:hypothetical protein
MLVTNQLIPSFILPHHARGVAWVSREVKHAACGPAPRFRGDTGATFRWQTILLREFSPP